MRSIAALVCAFILASCLDTPTERIKPSGADGSDGDGGSSTYCDTDDDCKTPLFSRCSSSHLCVACANSTQCTQFEGAPACVAGKGCFACSDDNLGTCTAERPLCSPEHECAQCTGANTSKCKGETPYCLEEAGTCVGCITSADCKDPAAGGCSATHACERCDADDDCRHFEATPFCATDRGECVACKTDGDCSAEAPVCDETRGVCGGCAENADCARFEGTKVCADSVCVECTGADDAACTSKAGGPFVCNALTNACADVTPRSADVCDACVSDAQCKTGQVCVRSTWDVDGDGAEETEVGWYCQWIKNGGGGAPMGCSSPDARPFSREKQVSSISSEEIVTVCALRAATCDSLSAYSQPCGRFGSGSASIIVDGRFDPDIPGQPVDAEDISPDQTVCGVTGKCVAKIESEGAYECTVPCLNNNNDCPAGPVQCGGDPPGAAGLCGI